MPYVALTKQGAFDADTMNALNTMLAALFAGGGAPNGVLALTSGVKIKAGVHTQVAASDTVATGLATVVAVIVNFQDAPTINQQFVSATIGDQAGAPAAGSFLLRTYKPTATGNVTPIPATVFTDNITFNYIAIGT